MQDGNLSVSAILVQHPRKTVFRLGQRGSLFDNIYSNSIDPLNAALKLIANYNWADARWCASVDEVSGLELI